MRRYPVNGQPIITNNFRDDKYNPHYGEDLAVPRRAAVLSLAAGVVVEVKNTETRQWLANTASDPYKPFGFPVIKRGLKTEDYGNYIKISHGNNIHTLYAHLESTEVFRGQSVAEGELIGYADSTGNSTGNHIHTEIRINNKVVDPNKFDYSFKGAGGTDPSFTEYAGFVEVRSDVSSLHVRSGPSTTSPLSGSKKLKSGTTGIKVKGFVEGEEIAYNLGTKEKPNMVKTNLWWVSQFGNFFWSGGTKPSAESVLIVKKKGIKMTPEEIQKLEDNIANAKNRIAELKADLKANEDAVAELEAKKSGAMVVEETTQDGNPPVDEQTAPGAADESVEATNEDREDAISTIKEIMEKHGISTEEL